MSNFNNLSSEDEEYIVHLPYHLAMAGMSDDLYDLLTEFEFIDTKVFALGTQPLIADYDLALQPEIITSQDKLKGNVDNLKLIQGALRLSAHILDEDKTQLAGQLLGRLMSFEAPEIKNILEQAKPNKNAPWLRPLTPTLAPPGEQLLRTLKGHTRPVTSVAVTSDGKRVISGSGDNTLKVWNLETGEELFTLRGHTLPITSVAVTPDGKLAISSSLDKTLKVWDLEARKELFNLIGHTCMVTAIAVTPDGKQVISGSLDKTLKVWDLESRKEVRTITLKVQNRISLLKLISILIRIPFIGKIVWLFFIFVRFSWVNALVVTSDCKQVILALNSNLLILNLETGETVFLTKDDMDGVTTLTAIPESRLIIYGFWDGTIQVANLETGEEFSPLRLEFYSTWISAVAVTPDGKRLVSGSLDNTIKIWNINQEKEIFNNVGHTAGVNAVAVIPNGKQLISGSGDNTLKVWNWQTGEEISSIKVECFPAGITALAVTPDGQQVIAGLSDKTIRAWNLETGEEIFTLKGLASSIKTLTVTPDGKQIISSLSNKTIKVWDWQNRKENFILKCPVASIKALAITPDGKQIIYGSWDNTIKIWSLEKRKELFSLTAHTKKIESVAVTSDGKRMISTSRDKTINVWDLEIRKKLFTLTGHTAKVTSVAVTSDGKWVISGSWDKTIKVWNLSNEKIISSFTGESELSCCTVAPDGVTIIAGERSGRLHFLRLEGM